MRCFSKEITITNGGYEVIGADWICSTEGAEWTNSGTLETRAVDSEAVEAIKAADKDYIIVDQTPVIRRWTQLRGATASMKWAGNF